jgi:hypothetical protein
LSEFDVIGFCSRHLLWKKLDKTLLEFAGNLPKPTVKNICFLNGRCNSQKRPTKFHEKLKNNLTPKGYEVVGEFNCPGFDTFEALRLIGGINKGGSNEEDVTQSQTFAQNLKEKT